MQPVDVAVKRDFVPDRRSHVRYPMHGSLLLEMEQQRYEATPVDISLGGILFRSERLPPLHSSGRMQLTIDGFGENIIGDVRVIDVRGTVAAANYLLPWTILPKLIAWLDSRASGKKGLQSPD